MMMMMKQKKNQKKYDTSNMKWRPVKLYIATLLFWSRMHFTVCFEYFNIPVVDQEEYDPYYQKA